jgi:NAD-specific glutamate dehydrogenase
MTPDIEEYQYRIRAIDFDQQSYEGRKSLYIPQFFKENRAYVELCIRHLNKDSIEQYQTEERTLMAFRVASSRHRLMELLNIMSRDAISTPEKLTELKTALAGHFQNPAFQKCRSMGQLVKRQMKQTLQKNLALIQKNLRKSED